ncbi:thiamine-phosphate diphosphorylase [Nakamurella panacisegetis]|uniref:Thiamine-phosphate synthase n=1 Tax=Nakamurella panacisegetis TaxID=1090615 RepID=A0A1H0MUC6_9ACTN|nr:thiamine phosphate synthase [Nakamurella panacisegetis]SDO83896.1 thiamine-phosphate diphosphorylase [Nakamurella panacisegetis]
MSRIDASVYLVTDTVLCGGPAGVVDTVRRAVTGGVSAVQIRDPLASTRDLAALATAVLDALRETGIPVIVNDRVDVALAVGAHGVHVGQRDLHPLAARRLIGPAAHLGLSVSTEAELRDALMLPDGTVDLLGVGPIRDTPSKTDAAPAIGFDALAAMCAAGSVPCVAIGGVKAADIPELRRAGAVGLAVISAICGQADPAAAAATLRRGWDAP